MPIKVSGWLGKVFSVIGKITDVLVKGRQAGLWNTKPGPQIKPNTLLGVRFDDALGKNVVGPATAEAAFHVVIPQKYNAWVSVEKGLRAACAFALYGIGGAFVGWLMNAQAVTAFLQHVGAPEALLGLAVLGARGLGAFISNLLKNYDPAVIEGQE